MNTLFIIFCGITSKKFNKCQKDPHKAFFRYTTKTSEDLVNG